MLLLQEPPAPGPAHPIFMWSHFPALLPTPGRPRAQMELLSLTRSFSPLSYGSPRATQTLIPGSASPETDLEVRRFLLSVRGRGHPSNPSRTSKKYFYYDFLVTFTKSASYPFPKDKDYCHTKAGINSDNFRIFHLKTAAKATDK